MNEIKEERLMHVSVIGGARFISNQVCEYLSRAQA